MKQVTTMSRLTNQLEKMFRMLNADFFDNALDTPVITVTPSARSYAHYTPWDAWQTKDQGRREVNIASGTLDRPIEAVCCSLLHEMCHQYNDTILNAQDCSRGGTYHNRYFRDCAEAHGLICTKTDRYGWSHTEPSDILLEWILSHNELREIEMCRVNPGYAATGTGIRIVDRGLPAATTKSNSRRYICPCCHTIIRATRSVNVICGDCLQPMFEN